MQPSKDNKEKTCFNNRLYGKIKYSKKCVQFIYSRSLPKLIVFASWLYANNKITLNLCSENAKIIKIACAEKPNEK